MERFIEVLKENLSEDLHQIVISNLRKTSEISKIKVRPCAVGNQIVFQFSCYKGKQVIHVNLDQEKALERIKEELETNFKQIEIISSNQSISALVSKKNQVTMKIKNQKQEAKPSLQHNRKKNYLIPDNQPIPFLVDLGVQTPEGKIVDKMYHKFKQINRFLEFVQDILPHLDKNKKLTIVDFGCGKSYLTFAMYYYLKVVHNYQVKMIGLDLKKDVIVYCNSLRTKYGYDDLDFYEGDISTYKGVESVDMVVTLHACDTATDYALAKAVHWGARVILSVPCCQHEANRQIENSLLAPVFKYGILKERMAALLTDGIRANLLEEQGYQTDLLEFVDMSHTPKNILIRAVKVQNTKPKENQDTARLCHEMGLNLTLEKLLQYDIINSEL